MWSFFGLLLLRKNDRSIIVEIRSTFFRHLGNILGGKTAAAIWSFQQGSCAQGDAFAPPKPDSSGSGSEHGWGPWDQQLLQLYLGPGAAVALGLLWIWTLAWPLSDVEEEEEGGDTPEAAGGRRGANLEDCVFASMLCCFPESCCMPTIQELEPEPETKPG